MVTFLRTIFVTYCQFLHLDRQGLSLGQQAAKKVAIIKNCLDKIERKRLETTIMIFLKNKNGRAVGLLNTLALKTV